VLAAGVPLVVAGTLIALGGGAGDLAGLLSDTRVGAGVTALAVAAALALALIPASRRTAGAAAPPPGWALALGLPPAAALGAMSWMGHASSGGDAGLNVGADMVHNWATALWVGGLLGLLALLLPAGRRLEPADRMRLLAQSVVRFSTLATVAVALLVVTGVYRALAEVGGLGDLLDTGYGLALLAKLGVFAVMLAVAGYNRFVLHPGMERAALGLPGGGPEAAHRLARSVRAELALAALVLVAVAVLVSTAPTA
jgi:putative copper export protein